MFDGAAARFVSGRVVCPAIWSCPRNRRRWCVVFAHGSGSSRRSPRNLAVAEVMHDYRLSTLLFDLLGEDEALERRHVFDIGLLGHRLGEALAWMRQQEAAPRRIGLFGASTGAAAALLAAARHPGWVGAVVARGGRPDLAAVELAKVQAPTLLDRGRSRRRGAAAEPHGSARTALPCAAGSGARRHAPVRGAGRAGNRGPPGGRVVHHPPARTGSGMTGQVFADRTEAGRALARRLVGDALAAAGGGAGAAARRRAGGRRGGARAARAAGPAAGAQDRRALAAANWR